ncbi:MAG: hypothetical protein Q9180_005035 [Flavoplaca navasiana]
MPFSTGSWHLLVFTSFLLYIGASLGAKQIDRAGWNCNIDSWSRGNECAMAIDGNTASYWHTEWDSQSPDPLPHYFKIDLGQQYSLTSLTYLPRQGSQDDTNHGNIGRWQISLSSDGNTWRQLSGTFADDQQLKTVDFVGSERPIPARFFKLMAYTEAGDRGPWSSAAEFNLFEDDSSDSDELFSVRASTKTSSSPQATSGQLIDASQLMTQATSLTQASSSTQASSLPQPSNSVPSSISNSDSDKEKDESHGLNKIQTIATVIGVVIGFLALVVSLYFGCRRKRRR